MTWHPTDEDLILHFYGDSRPADRGRLDAHLGACALCRSAWTDLGETMSLVDSAAVPEPGTGFERVVWARVQGALPAPAPPASRWSLRLLMPVSGLMAAVMILLAVGLQDRLARPAGADVAAPASSDGEAAAAQERVLLTALDTHLEQTEMLLVELMNAPDVDAHALEFERETADDLVASGRLYRMTAAEHGDGTFVRILEDLESVLVDVARSPTTVDRGEMASLRARIDGADLLFKVRAATNEIRGRQQAMFAVSSEGPL